MKLGKIYKITCISNNKFIIGSSICYEKRKGVHLSLLRNNKHANDILQNCFNKYGEDNIKFEILQNYIPELILKDIENIWIGSQCSMDADKKGGMNMRDAYNGSPSKKSILKTKIKKDGWKMLQETKDKISKANKGKLKPISFGEKLSDIKSIPILQYDLNMNLIKEWKGAMDASIKLNGSFGNICACCRGERNKAMGFIWKYKNN
jgi:group I intron endonuclease